MPYKLPIPQSINYFWNFRSLIRITYTIQLISRIILSLRYYAGTRTSSFNSVELIVREVDARYIVRRLHLVRSQMIMLTIYLHIRRSLYFGRRANLPITLQRAVILLITIGAAFLGYVLPWRQMSFWRATVITGFLGVLPIRQDILEWVWRGFTVRHPTLTRFFSLHYLLRLLIAPLSLLHIVLLHNEGSGRPLGDRNDYYLPFWPYYGIKDMWPAGILISCIIIFTLFLRPETENLKNANPIVTPTHIKPEWYFLIFYAILRAVPSKVRRLLIMLLSILVLVALLRARKNYSNSSTGTFLASLFISTCILLRLLGRKPVEEPFLTISLLLSLFYFRLAAFIILV